MYILCLLAPVEGGQGLVTTRSHNVLLKRGHVLLDSVGLLVAGACLNRGPATIVRGGPNKAKWEVYVLCATSLPALGWTLRRAGIILTKAVELRVFNGHIGD